MVPCRRPGRGPPASAPAPSPPQHRRRKHRPSAPTPLPLTETTAPGASPGTCSRGTTAAVGPEHDARHSFLWPPPEAALGPRWPVTTPIALPVTARRRPRPGAKDTAAWPAAGDRCPPRSSVRRWRPRVHVPLFRPLEGNPETGLRYPGAISEKIPGKPTEVTTALLRAV
jgi:hypothetical protein